MLTLARTAPPQPARRSPRTFGSALLVAALFAWFSPLTLAMRVAEFSTDSFTLASVNAPVSGSAIFGFDVASFVSPVSAESGPVQDFGYLNVRSGTSWLVQNEPIPLNGNVAFERNNLWFTDFGARVGAAALDVEAVINDQPVAVAQDIPDSEWTLQESVLPSVFDWGFDDYTGQSGPVTPVAVPPITPVPPPDALTIEGYLRGGVSDIRQYWNECGPTSTANSLIWLAGKYGFTDKLPKLPDGSLDQAALVLALAKIMKPAGFTPDNSLPAKNGYANRGYPGLDGNQLKDGATAYLNTLGIRFVTEGGNADAAAKGANTFAFVEAQLRKGEDVEFLIKWPGQNTGYHWVTVTGFIDAGVNNKTLIVHDPLAANGNHYWKIRDDGTLTAPVGAAAWAVAQSIPEPDTLALLGAACLVLVSGRAARTGRRWGRGGAALR